MAVVAAITVTPAAAVDWELTIDAAPSLSAVASRVRNVDADQIAQALARAGLELPLAVRVTLVPEEDPIARRMPDWIVGRAFGSRDVLIIPERVAAYPYDSLESVLRHEVVHLALFERADGRPLPRWFHEGVAVSVEAGWGFTDNLKLLLAAGTDPAVADLTRLFQSDARPETERAYRLAAALVDDMRRRHGAGAPGAIARHVARGVPFARAFELETGETPDEAAALAWATYRRWTTWLPFITSGSALWTAIMALAFVAFFVRLVQRARRRRRLDEDPWTDEHPWDDSWRAEDP